MVPPPHPTQELRYEYRGSGPVEPPKWQGTGADVGGPSGCRRRPSQPLFRLITRPHAGPGDQQLSKPFPNCLASPLLLCMNVFALHLS